MVIEISTKTIGLFIGMLAGILIGIWTLLSPAGLFSPTITEEATVLRVDGDSCVVETSDTILSAKTLKNCDLPEGSKVMVTYQKGSVEAQMAQP